MDRKKDKRDDEAPFPETDYSPALQRTLRRKFEEAEDGGELDSVDRDEFLKMLGKTAEEQPESRPSAEPEEGCDPSE